MSRKKLTDAHERALQTFHQEAREMVEQMEQSLLALEENPEDRELLNGLFRSVHTIKGSGGLFGLDALVGFTHQVEGELDRLRNGTLSYSQELSSTLLACADQIAVLLDYARKQPEADPPEDVQAQSALLLEQLCGGAESTAALPVKASAKATGKGAAQGGTALANQAGQALVANVPNDGIWHISLRFGPDSFLQGIDPLATVRYLGSLGELLLVETFDRPLPKLSELVADRCYIGFEIRLKTLVTQVELDDAVEFISDSCKIHIISPAKDFEQYAKLIEDLPEDADRLGEILVACGAITRAQLHEAMARQHAEAVRNETTRQLGAILIDEAKVDPKLVDVALRKQANAREKTDDTRFFRVQADKLDALINTVGELVILGSAAKMQAQASGDAVLLETTHQMGALVEEIRNSSLALRMVAIGESFTRYKRVVRDIASKLGKELRLDIEGGDTELDKSVVEKIGDPLMHLVRNALDHGLETPAERQAAGKPSEGRLLLSAWHDSGSIVIQVRDDGRGIDPEKILRKARENGLVAHNAALSQAEILNLIFEPGLSTASQVSDISGRGVGMDVVRRNIEALRGTVSIASEIGVGTAMTIRLPLTLAIIDGFLVRCGHSCFVIPLEHVEECIAGTGSIADQRAVGVIDRRGVPLSVLSVSRMLDVQGEESARPSIVVVRHGDARVGLLVDHLLGEHQTVIKPLGQLFQPLRFAAGSTILGTGEVAIILDVAALAARVNEGREFARQTLSLPPPTHHSTHATH